MKISTLLPIFALWASLIPVAHAIEYAAGTDSDGDGWTVGAGDCDDHDPNVHPGATEYCDGLDNDCNGFIDDNPADLSAWYPDSDMDGFGDEAASAVMSCTNPGGFVNDNTDCDDTNSNVNPGAIEIDDGLDNDCDGLIDNLGAAAPDVLVNTICCSGAWNYDTTLADNTWDTETVGNPCGSAPPPPPATVNGFQDDWWFLWLPTLPGTYVLDTCATTTTFGQPLTNYNTKIAVWDPIAVTTPPYPAAGPEAIGLVACNDDGPPPCASGSSEVVIEVSVAQAATGLLIQCGGYSFADFGPAVLTITDVTPPEPSPIIQEIIDPSGDGGGHLLDNAHGVAVDGVGNAFVSGFFSNNVFKITPDGTITEIVDASGAGAGSELNWAGYVAADSSGNSFVSGLLSQNVLKITDAGMVTEILNASGDGLGSSLDLPGWLSVDSNGNVFVPAGGSGVVFKVTGAGGISVVLDLTGTGLRPHSTAVDASGNLYVASQGSSIAGVHKVTPGGQVINLMDETGDGLGNILDTPAAIAVDSKENVYVTGQWSKNVFKITPGGQITEVLDETGDGAGNLVARPYGITTDTSDNVYVTDNFNHGVFKIDPCGGITMVMGLAGDGAGNPLDSSAGIAANSNGEVFVAGQGSANAFRITPPNSGAPFCFGDGTQSSCPCGAVGASGHGCPNTNPNGKGARLTGTGNADFASDTFALLIQDGGPNKPGILIQGAANQYPNGTPNVPNASGIFCVNPGLRGNVFFTDANGYALETDFKSNPFGSTAEPPGSTTYYQYWFRDPGNPCQNAPANTAAFNFSNGWEVEWR